MSRICDSCSEKVEVEDDGEGMQEVTHFDNLYGSYMKFDVPIQVCDECYAESYEEICGICECRESVESFYENWISDDTMIYYRKEYEDEPIHDVNGIYDKDGTLLLKGHGDEMAVCDKCADKARDNRKINKERIA